MSPRANDFARASLPKLLVTACAWPLPPASAPDLKPPHRRALAPAPASAPRPHLVQASSDVGIFNGTVLDDDRIVPRAAIEPRYGDTYYGASVAIEVASIDCCDSNIGQQFICVQMSRDYNCLVRLMSM
eukprot:6179058-Pleurochrysis_carterae.AAC.3